MEKKRVCHFTSAHDSHDDRIFLKECDALCKAGYEVNLVAKGEDNIEDGIKIIGCGTPKGRIDRILFFSRRVYKKAEALDCDIYHFHDPELLPYGVKLSRKGKKVIFDSHEDVPAQILDKQWIPKQLRGVISTIYKRYETFAVRHFAAVVTATDYIAHCFEGRARKTVVINNYPKLDDILYHDMPFSERKPIVCYAGGISEIRGEKVMIEAMKGIDADLILAGDHEIESFKNDGGGFVRYIGQIDRNSINHLYGEAKIGLCLLLPAHNYINSMPIKLFEYMAAGIPFVASDFSLWEKLAENTGAGMCVDVNDIKQIREAINMLLKDDELCKEMALRGRNAVEKSFSWDMEGKKLCNLYGGILP